MTNIEINHDGFVIDAAVPAEAFKLAPHEIHPLMRSGEITSVTETGVGEDEGRARLTFHYGGRTVRLVVDEEGTILKRSSFPSRSRMSISAGMFPIPTDNKPKVSSW